ncbi:MAG: DUF4440 domain-containing protein [Gammaproteobacteria bacterium]|nr:DUF4440 domain-containing protein [Gammaproteobacteria bacterium]
MDSETKTDPKLFGVLEELKQLEKQFHYPDANKTRVDFESLMDEVFWEVGASGRAYDKAFVLDCLEVRSQESTKVAMGSFNCLEIASECYLLSYIQIENSRTTRHSAIWRKINTQWKSLYHQGTVCCEVP